MSRAAHIEIREVEKRFGDFQALRGVSLSIEKGEFLTLLGPSGSGKTTLLNLLAGFETVSAGAILKDGEDIAALPADKRNFGMVFQGYALFPHMSVADNVAFPLKARGMPRKARAERAQKMIEMVGLKGHERKRPDALSGGQRQRVALARALSFEPELLLLDEPLSALDKTLREQLQAELVEVHRKTGTTFVFVTHDQEEALAMSDRIAIFDHGRIVQVGAPEALYHAPASRFAAEFLGSINLFALEGLVVDGGWAQGAHQGRMLCAPAPEGPVAAPLLTVRPEFLRLSPTPPGAGETGLPGTFQGRVFQGASSLLKAALPDGREALLHQPAASPAAAESFAAGAPLWVVWDIARGRIIDDA